MNLKDCLQLKGITAEDAAAIEASIAGGATESAAVLEQLRTVDAELGQIAAMVEDAGGQVARVPTPAADQIAETDVIYELTSGAPVDVASAGDVAVFEAAGTEGASTAAQALREQNVKNVQTGTFMSGITRVSDPAAAAHVVAPLRKEAQESMLALITDASDNVLSVVRHTTGLIARSAVSPVHLSSAIHNTPGAAKVWLAHNHPSGKTTQSSEDINITDKLSRILKGSGVESQGMVVVTPGGKASYLEPQGFASENIAVTPAARGTAVPVTERRIRTAAPLTEGISSPARAKQIAKQWAQGREGILLLSSQHSPVGFVEIPESDLEVLRTGEVGTGASRLFQEIGKRNAAAMIAWYPGANDSRFDNKGLANLDRFAATVGIRHLDTFVDGGDFSYMEAGRIGEGGTFLQSGILYQDGYSGLDPETKEIVDYALEGVENPEKTRELLDEYKDTPWAKQAIAGARARAALDELVAGRDPEFDSVFNAPKSRVIREAIKNRGADAIWQFFQAGGTLSHPSKPVHSVNSSFLNCEPSKACAEYCYAAKGRNFASILIRAELTDWAVKNDPVRFAKRVAEEYKITADFMAGKALRLFERGDGHGKWADFVRALNAGGVRAHVFSRRPEFLRRVHEDNVRLLSVNGTNTDMAEANTDLPIAYIYTDQQEIAWLNEFKADGGEVQVVLPVVNKGNHLTDEQIAAVPKWAKPLVCPIDKGGITIGKGKGEWNCARCDAGGGVGCYHKNTTKKVWDAAKMSLEEIVDHSTLANTLKEINDVGSKLDERGRALLREELDNILSQARAGLEPETKGDAAQGVRDGVAQEEAGPGVPGEDGGILYQRGPALKADTPPTFYSALTRSIEQLNQPANSAQGWKQIIRKNLPQKGVKQAEIQWSGVIDWLDEQRGKVTKTDLVAYLRSQAVTITDVSLAEDIADEKINQWMKENEVEVLFDGERKKWVITSNDGMWLNLSLQIESFDTEEVAWDYVESEAATALAMDESEVKFGAWQMEGEADGYAELLLTIPDADPTVSRLNQDAGSPQGWAQVPTEYISEHWDQPNVAVHVRHNTREINGKRTLFIEEVQSDWASDIRKGVPGTPDLPFRATESYALLAMKRMIRHAAENGYEQIAWTPGEVQNDRYSLGRRIDELEVQQNILGSYDVFAHKDGDLVMGENVDAAGLQNLFGMELAEKVLSEDPVSTDSHGVKTWKFAGTGLSTEGQGMIGFYDKILPKAVGKYAKKWGAKVGTGEIDTGIDVWTLPVTDKMRDAALAGQPLFQRGLTREEYARLAKVDPERDSLLVAIAKLGGISMEQAQQYGLDKADLKGKGWRILRAFNDGPKAEGFDGMRERLDGFGYRYESFYDLIDDIQKEIAGNKIYSETGAEARLAESDEMRRIEDEQQADFDLPPDVEFDGHMHIAREYDPNWSEDARTVMELYEEASTIDADAADAIFESGADDNVIALQFFDLIRSARNVPYPEGTEGDQGPSPGPPPSRYPPPEAPRGVEAGDLPEADQEITSARGWFDPAQNVIGLTQASDLSTFLHESGHMFLNMERLFAEKYGVTDDHRTMLDWMGVESFEQIGVEQHEQFAETFELYLQTGKAPSLSLRRTFAAFSRWLTKIYSTLTEDRRERANLTVEISDFMGRMLATDAEIMAARSAPIYDQFFRSAEQAGMTDAEWKKYTEQVEKSRNTADAAVNEKVLKEWRARRTREWKEEKAVLIDEERARLVEAREYKVLADAKENMLDYAALKEINGGKFPGKFTGKARKGGADPQELAEIHGYESAEQMITAVQSAPALSKAADAAAEARMVEKHGDILNDGTIEDEVEEALHNEEQAKLLLMELQQLRRRTGQPEINRDLLKAEARRVVQGMRYKEIKPGKFYRSEIRAAKKAATAKTDEEALEAKIQQIANHYYYREAVETRRRMENQRKYVRGVQDRTYKPTQVDPEYSGMMKLLANLYFMQNRDRQLADVQRLVQWYNGQVDPETGRFPDLTLFDPTLANALLTYNEGDGNLADIYLPTFDDMTAADLEGLYDTLRHFRFVGGALSDEARAEVQRDRETLAESIVDNGGRDARKTPGVVVRGEKLREKVSHAINLLPNLNNLLRNLDGFKDWGPAQSMLYASIEDANTKKMQLKREMYERFEGELGSIHTIGLERGKGSVKVYRLENGGSLSMTPESRFMLAAYWGTETSREALIRAHDLAESDVMAILSDMTDEQLRTVNALWKVNESMWGELRTASIARLGVAPPKLDPTPYTVNGIHLTGGHMRLFYDSVELEMLSEESQQQMGAARSIVPSRAGSTYARVGSGGRPPLLDKNNIVRAIEDNIHFIAFGPASTRVAALVNGRNVRDAIVRKHGEGFYRALTENLTSVVGNKVERESVAMLAAIFRLLRKAATFKHLAYSIRNTVQQITAIKPAMDEVGTFNLVGAMARFHTPGQHAALADFVHERSEYMRDRGSVVNREAAEYLRMIMADNKAHWMWNQFARMGFAPQTFVDARLAYPVWIAKYESEIGAHGDEQRAISKSNTAVAETVGSGTDLHLGKAFHSSNIEFIRLFTVFGSWFNAYYQRIYKASRAGTDYANLETVQAVITTPLVVGMMSAALIMDGLDDEEEFWHWALKNWAKFLGGTVPVLRDIVSTFEGFSPKTVWSAGGETPSKIVKEVGTLIDGEQTPLRATKDIAAAVTTVVPVPGAGNILRLMDYVDSAAQGNEPDYPLPLQAYQAVVEGRDKNQ